MCCVGGLPAYLAGSQWPEEAIRAMQAWNQWRNTRTDKESWHGSDGMGARWFS
jgi:hypothetical protein